MFDKLLRRTEDPRRNELIKPADSHEDSWTDESDEFIDSEESDDDSDCEEEDGEKEDDFEDAESTSLAKSELVTNVQKGSETPTSRAGEPSEKG
jgi:hypothetical protein